MAPDDRFDELIASLNGFYRSWVTYLGLDLGLFARLREAGPTGVTPTELAAAAGLDPTAVDAWAWAADVHDLAVLEGGRLSLPDELAEVLLDEDRPEYLGGQFIHSIVSSLDWDRMAGFFRTGRPERDLPDRHRAAIERLTMQDIAVFFQEVLGLLPQLVADLARGSRVLDVHCGGGRWLVAMARRFPSLEGVGVEFEADSAARARASVEAAGVADRVTIWQGDVAEPAGAAEFDLAYFQYALHSVPSPAGALRAAWVALKPGGRLLVLDWPLPSTPDEARSDYGQLIAGINLDELMQGTALATRERILEWFASADLAEPEVLDLPSGATAWLLVKPA